MRTTSTILTATLVTLLTAGTVLADSGVPGDPGYPGGPRPDSAVVSLPELTPQPGQARPSSAWSDHLEPIGDALKGQLGSLNEAQADAQIDAMLGVLQQGSAAAEGAKHIYVNDDGDLACVTLDTFFPEPC